MENALLAVKKGMNLCKAHSTFGVPKQTLSDRINHRWKSTIPSRQTALQEDEERSLVHYIKYMASIAHPQSVPAIKAFAWNIAKGNRSNRFNPDTGPGHIWWAKFKEAPGRNYFNPFGAGRFFVKYYCGTMLAG